MMTQSQFKIGDTFWTEFCAWRCTDVGSRTACAIELCHPSEPHLYEGPPYTRVENLFDETDMKGCYLTREEMVKELGDTNILVWEKALKK